MKFVPCENALPLPPHFVLNLAYVRWTTLIPTTNCCHNLMWNWYKITPNMIRGFLFIIVLFYTFIVGCTRSAKEPVFYGWIEGRYTSLQPSVSGVVATLTVREGAEVHTGDVLMELEPEPESFVLEQAKQRLETMRALRRDFTASQKRPEEIAVITEQLRAAQASQEELQPRYERYQILQQSGTVTQEELETSEAALRRNEANIRELEQQLRVASLSARADRIAALDEEIRREESLVAQAEWNLAEKRIVAPKDGLIDQICYRTGERTTPGRPVMTMIAPEDIRIRFFVPQTQIGKIQVGDPITTKIDGRDDPISATVTMIFHQPEYTPPVIYSNEVRTKFVFMVEAEVPLKDAVTLHPGQPITIFPDTVRRNHE